jgi:hypothetical protein
MISVAIGFVLGFACCYGVHHMDQVQGLIASIVSLIRRK